MVLTSLWTLYDGAYILILYSLCISGHQPELEPKTTLTMKIFPLRNTEDMGNLTLMHVVKLLDGF